MAGAALLVAFSAIAVTVAAARQPAQPLLTVAGVAQDPCQQQRALPVPARLSGQFEPDSSVLRTAAGVYAAPGRAAPPTRAESACVAAAERADRDWLRAGRVPGATATQRAMATRALLDLRLAVQPDGAVLAGWHSGQGYQYAWPRDSSWVAAALAGTGHPAMAYRILRFLQRMQSGNGTWAARYLLDGSGPVRDGRPAELDADGWVPWAVWSWASTQQLRPGSGPRRELALLWPMVTRAADAAARSLTRDGLPGRRWITGRTRFRSRWVRPPRCWPACAPPLTWPRTSAVRQPPATAAAGRPRRPGWPQRSRRRSPGAVTSARRRPGQAPMRPSRSSGRPSRCRALGCCERPGQHSGCWPSPTAACGLAQAGPARPASPGPGDRILRAVRCRDRAGRPGSGAAGLARRPPDAAGLAARTGSVPPAGQPRQPRCPGPTR